MSSFADLMKFSEFKEFVVNNNLVTYSVSWAVAVVATKFIESFVGDIILPSIYYLLLTVGAIHITGVSSIFESVNKINIPSFMRQLLTFAIVLLITFFMIQEILRQWVSSANKGSAGSAGSAGDTATTPSGGGGTATNARDAVLQDNFYYFSGGGGGAQPEGHGHAAGGK